MDVSLRTGEIVSKRQSNRVTALHAIERLTLRIQFEDIGPVLGDIEKLVRWIDAAIEDGRELDVATLARIAKALE